MGMDLHAAFPSTFRWCALFCGPDDSCSERHVRCRRRFPTEEGCLALKAKHRLFDVVPKRDGIRQQLPLMCRVPMYNAVLQRASEGAGYSVTCGDG